MRLSRVEISGFKSFGHTTSLSFSKGITSIIGPNGSGKSNISEAIKWVLGEQSIKELRGKSRQDVIFSGNKKSRKASVKLVLDNESGRFPLKAAEVSIERSLASDGGSTYLLNGDPVKLFDIQHMLAQAGIGAKSYTVISQGTVDKYLTATPEKRRELFDEATGIRSLQLKLGQAQKKLRKTRDHADELRVIIQELLPRLSVLQRQISRYEEREQCEKELRTKQHLWLHHTVHAKKKEVLTASERVNQAQKRIQAAQKERAKAEDTLLHSARNEHTSEQAKRLELDHARSQFNAAKIQYERITQEHHALNRSLQDIRQQRKQAESELQKRKHASLHVRWLDKAQTLLGECASFLTQYASNEPPSQKEARALSKSIAHIMQQYTPHDSHNSAESVLQDFEKPLQNVARLIAIEEEREKQLQTLPKPVYPTQEEERFRKLEQSCSHITSSNEHTVETLQKTLEQARTEEIRAEREGSAAHAAATQTAQALRDVEQDILREYGSVALQEMQDTQPSSDSVSVSLQELQQLSDRISSLGDPDPLIIKEFQEVRERHDRLQSQLADVEETARKITDMTHHLEEDIQKHFHTQFKVIQDAFAQFFTNLFGGGRAVLSVEGEGIDITVAPPGKRARHIALLSGGERALTSLALLLAILEAQKPPFVVLDEVDAALDEANSQRFARILRTHTQDTQSIVITHNRETMAQADVLYGVTMQKEGISTVYSVNMSEIDHLPEESRERIMSI